MGTINKKPTKSVKNPGIISNKAAKANVAPDIMSLAKGLGGGFPIGAILSSKEASKGMVPGTHGSTFGGNYLACVSSLTVLNHISQPNFLKNVSNRLF